MDSWGQGDWVEFQEQSDEGRDAENGESQANADATERGESFLEDTDGTYPGEPGGADTSGSYRMPPIPSRPLGPHRSYISGAPASPYQDQSQGWLDPDAGAYSQPLPMGPGGFRNPPPPPPGGGYPRTARQPSDGGSGHSGWRRAWILLLGAVLLLVICASAGMLTGFLPQILGISGANGSNNHPGGLVQDSPTATPTATIEPTATPVVPTAATISFSTATTQRSSSGSMTSCPSGCNIVGASYSNSQGFSGSYAASFVPQSRLYAAGAIHVHTNAAWTQSGVVFSGNGYSCAAQDVSLAANTSDDYDCFVGASSPSSLPVNTINGTADGGHATYTQQIALQGDAHYKVQPADCTNALNDLHNNQGKPWAQAWFAGQSAPAGWQFALSSPTITFSSDSCPTGQQQTSAFNFTASTTTSVRDAAYNPAAAQSLASSRLDGALPGGYQWQNGTRTTCAPTVKSVDASNKVTLNCSDSATAYYVWTSSAKSQLAGKLAGQTKTQALAICNKTAGVRANTCSISIIGGDGTALPESADALVIVAKGP